MISLSILWDGVEDLKRYKSDLITNSNKTIRYDFDQKIWLTEILWSDLEVGDIIMVKKDEPFPADLVLLCSSNQDGQCYIMTSSLDGEKNLKPKYSVKEI